MTEKFSVSTSEELFEALEGLRERRGEDRSRLIETVLREHPMVRREIHRQRSSGLPCKGERRSEEIEALARTARRQWALREDEGEVAFLDR